MNVYIRSSNILLDALVQTMALALTTMVCAAMAGLLLAEISRSRYRVPRWLVGRYVDLVRGVPILVFLFLIYYLLPLFGLSLPRFFSAVIALSLYFSGYTAEVMRGAMTAIPSGQIQSAVALGMRKLQLELVVVLPQALRIAIPPLMNLSSIIIKSTSLVSIIGVWELTLATREIAVRTIMPLQFFTLALVIYFIVCFSIVQIGRYMEKRFAKAYA